MTAGADVVCSDVVRKVEVTVGVGAKEDADDSSYVFVSGGEPDDAGGGNVDEFGLKSDSADGVDRSKDVVNEPVRVNGCEVKGVEDEVRRENGSDSRLVVESDVIVKEVNGYHEKVLGKEEAVVDSEIENVGIKVDDVGSGAGFETELEGCPVTVVESDPVVNSSDVTIAESVSTPDVVNTPDESLSTDYKGSNGDCEVIVNDGTESVSNVIDKADDGSGKPSEDLEGELTADVSESSVSPTEEEGGRVIVDESGKPSDDMECQVSANSSESSVSPTEEREGPITIEASGKPSEDLECQVPADGSESSGSPTEEQEGPVTAVESVKPSEDLASQVVADEPESFGSPEKERECEVSVDGSDSNGNLADNQERSASVESELSGDHFEEVDGKSEEHQEVLVINSKINGEAEPDDVSGGLKAEHQSVSVSVPCQSENKKAEETDIGLRPQSEETRDSGVVLSWDTDALANGQAKKFDGNLEMGETQISDTEADKSVPLKDKSEETLEKQTEESSKTLPEVAESVENEASSEDKKEHVNVQDEIQESQIAATNIVEDDLNLENNTTESANEADVPLKSETNNESVIHVDTASQYEVSNSVDESQEAFRPEESSETIETVDLVISERNNSELLVVNDRDLLSTHDDVILLEHVKVEDEIRGYQIAATDIIEDDLNLEKDTTESTNEAEEPLETETNIESVSHACTASQYEVSNSVDIPQEGFRTEGGSENIETVDLVMSECNNGELIAVEDNNSLSAPDESIVVEQKAEIVDNLGTEHIAAEGMDCGSGIENGDVSVDDEKETEVKDASVEYVPDAVTKNTGVENVDVSDNEERGAEVKNARVESVPVTENISAEGTDCGTGVDNIDLPDDEEKEIEVKDVTVGGHPTLSFSDTIVNSGAVIEFGSIGRPDTTHNIQNEEAEDTDGIQSDDIRTSSVEGSVGAIDVQNEEDEVLPYNFLIRIPRCDDETLKEQIRSAQLLVEEKTRLRDAIRVEIQEKRARLKAHNEAYNAAKTEETTARRLVRLKRQEIDSVQVVINRLKNAMSVEDIDGRIQNMEHMIQHETLLLKDEKQLIREIKQLKTLRDQLTLNMGSPEEIRQAIDQKDQNEERMKTLRKELESLKDKASKAEAAVKSVGKTYNEESRMERELQARFRAADDVRQNVYAQLNSLKKLSYDKNKSFRQFKDDLTAARNFASHGNKDALHRLCANQVETFMEQWNSNDEFRNEYISRCNINASRRLRALDGGPPVPDDVAPVLPGNVNEKADNSSVSTPGDVKSGSVVLPVEEGKIVSSTEKKHTDSNSNNRSIENVSGQKNQTLKVKGVAKPTGSVDAAVVTELVVDNKKEEENALTKEEIELAKKAEELRKEEIAAKLKEQRRLEEKAKAIEALERKKRNAEKAQIRAELRARKEAEQKEKEREKRLRKKEKKKTGGGDGSMNREEAAAVAAAASSESANEAVTKDTETVSKEKTKKKTAALPPHVLKQKQQLKPKPIPPTLVNRNRKRWQHWVKLALAVAAVFFLFMLGNTSYIRLKFNGLI